MSRSSRDVAAELRELLAAESVVCVELSFAADTSGRDAARPVHRERVQALYANGALLAAGPWRDDTGALLVFQLSEAEVAAELEADPYYSAPGVTIVQVRPWYPH
jgi:uncharacterized protein YciI